MFAKGPKALELTCSGEWVPGAYTVVPYPYPGAKGWVVVLEGVGGGCWYPTKRAAERAAGEQNRELVDAGLVWLYKRAGPT